LDRGGNLEEEEEEVCWRSSEDGWLVTYQGGAEAERFPRGDVPLAVVEEELKESNKKVVIFSDR
jgi:hypothetical protein